jgi:midasin
VQDNTIGDQPMLRLMETLEHTLEVARHEVGAGGIGAGTQDLAQLVLVSAEECWAKVMSILTLGCAGKGWY